MQNALATLQGGRAVLDKGVHDALDDFQWMHAGIAHCQTRIAELVPAHPLAKGHHDASGNGAGGVWFPGTNITPRAGLSPTKPLL